MVEHVLAALDGYRVSTVGAGWNGVPHLDDAAGSGPLAGIAAALSIDADAVFVTAVDHPWLRAETVQRLAERFTGSPVVPYADDRRQVLCCIYPTELVRKAARLAVEGAAIQALLDDLTVDVIDSTVWKSWGEDGRSWFSVDSPDLLIRGLATFGEPGGNREIS
jgi:molybdopterin-guanine dinucleotide biosynthesis protein A